MAEPHQRERLQTGQSAAGDDPAAADRPSKGEGPRAPRAEGTVHAESPDRRTTCVQANLYLTTVDISRLRTSRRDRQSLYASDGVRELTGMGAYVSR